MKLLEFIDKLKTIFSPEETYKIIKRVKTQLSKSEISIGVINFELDYKLIQDSAFIPPQKFTIYKIEVTYNNSYKTIIEY